MDVPSVGQQAIYNLIVLTFFLIWGLNISIEGIIGYFITYVGQDRQD
jgi:hypothetical protein